MVILCNGNTTKSAEGVRALASFLHHMFIPQIFCFFCLTEGTCSEKSKIQSTLIRGICIHYIIHTSLYLSVHTWLIIPLCSIEIVVT